jgi:hypothetical protein
VLFLHIKVGSAAVLRINSSVRPYTPLVDAVSPEAKVRDRVRRQWKSFQRDCREADSDSTSLISQQEFKRKYVENMLFLDCRAGSCQFLDVDRTFRRRSGIPTFV